MDLNFNDNLEKTRKFILDNVPYMCLFFPRYEIYIFFRFFFVCVSKNSLHLCLEIYFVIFQFMVSLFSLRQKIESKKYLCISSKFTTPGRNLLTLLPLIFRRLWIGMTHPLVGANRIV